MAARKFPSLSISIKERILLLLMSITAFAVLAVALVAVGSALIATSSAQKLSGDALRSQAENSLLQLNLKSARENDLILEQITKDAQQFAAYTAKIFENNQTLVSTEFWTVEAHMSYGPDGQYMNSQSDISSVFVPKNTRISQQIIEDIEKSAYLDLIFKSFFENNSNIEAIYFATPHEVTRYYPNINLGLVVPPDFKVTSRIWYTGSTQQRENPNAAWWTPVYLDATGLGVVTTAAVPVYNQRNSLIGVAGFDVTLTEMRANIEATQFMPGGYTFLIDGDGRAIALPDQGYMDILGRQPEPDEFGTDLTKTDSTFSSVVSKMLAGESGLQTIRGGTEELIVAFAPLKSTGWSMGSVVPSQNVLAMVSTLQQEVFTETQKLVVNQIFPVSAVIFVCIALIGLITSNMFVRPIKQLAVVAEKIGLGQWDVEIPIKRKDEIGLLARSFRTMADQLRELVSQLEDKIKERTKQLEKRASQLQASIDVGHAVASIRNLDELLSRVTHLISDSFGFYHAGIFLIDEDGDYAELRAANSEGGQRMLKRRHRLRIGEQGIVGFATSTGTAHIALDVGKDAVFFNNPDLPETRSEMAIPLMAGSVVLGALDVQSIQEAAFTEEDIGVLKGVADLVAVAIENAQLFAENQAALEATRRAYGELSEEAWKKLLQVRPPQGYTRIGKEPVKAVSGEWKPELTEAAKMQQTIKTSDQTLAIPIRIRDLVAGAVRLRKNSQAGDWTVEEEEMMKTMIEQLTVALESARLYQETQRRAERERLASEISAKLRLSNDPQTIIQTAITELRKALQVKKAQISLASPEASSGDGSNKGNGQSTSPSSGSLLGEDILHNDGLD